MADITIRISEKSLKLAVIVLCAILLVWGAFFLSSTGVFRPKYQILMFVPEAEGVHVGASVRLDGLPIGNVSRVELADNSSDSNRRIEIVLRIEKRFKEMIRAESNASLARGGLFGDRYVNIQRGFSGPSVNSGSEIRVLPAKELTFTDFIDAIGKKSDCQNEEKTAVIDKSPIAKQKLLKPQ